MGEALKALLRIAHQPASKPPEVKPAARPGLKLVDGAPGRYPAGDNGQP